MIVGVSFSKMVDKIQLIGERTLLVQNFSVKLLKNREKLENADLLGPQRGPSDKASNL